ncbi:hypothetical protein GCM10022225_60990 [Plantactinospora mayteni]|uniref:Uncharacterized protein n=1 Tax=Plantactinospora mayteni TaxID=566021 RepID=A0ABQ4EZQ7_9ACTN|nr:hypothetical protein Pma05_67310 [Plantactinospora mayteni]
MGRSAHHHDGSTAAVPAAAVKVVVRLVDIVLDILAWLVEELHGVRDYRREDGRWRRVDGPDR